MLPGYVVLYTDFDNFEQFLTIGRCVAEIKKSNRCEYKIVVPYQSVETEAELPKIACHMKNTVTVNLIKEKE